VSGRAAVAEFPARPAPGEIQICIYDRQSPVPLASATAIDHSFESPRSIRK
jgi:hypothetical protein